MVIDAGPNHVAKRRNLQEIHHLVFLARPCGGFFFGVNMLKRIFLALAVMAGAVSPSFGAGTVPGFSLTPQYDLTGHVAFGCQLSVYQAGTTSTPQIAYQDSSLTIPSPGGNVLSCDAAGRLPQFFLADGSIKLVLRDVNGGLIFSQDGLLVVGPSGGGGGATPVDPTTVLATGDLKVSYGTGILTGFVRANGRTLGSATSGATERANSDTQALFLNLWAADANLAVGGGRGVSAAADWAANKTIALPDWRGRSIAGLDDMGNTAAGRLTSTYFGTTATVLGAAGGGESLTLSSSQMPSHTHTGVTGTENQTHTHAGVITGGTTVPVNGTGSNANPIATLTSGSSGVEQQNHTHNFTTDAFGGGLPHRTVGPRMLATIYVKL
jgi:microcystin-dependent protein